MVNVPGPKKALKIGRALKSAAMLPTRVASGRGSGRSDALSPVQGEHPIVILRVQVIGCTGVAAKDSGGTSDPFVTVTVLSTKHQTPVVKKSLNPQYLPKDATFDFPLYLSVAEKLGAVELVVWDKDMLTKEYLGEASLLLTDWFPSRNGLGFNDAENMPLSKPLSSTRNNTPPEGTIQLKLGFVEPPNSSSLMSFEEIYFELARRNHPRASVMSGAPTHGIGTVRSHATGRDFEDDGFSSDDADDVADDTDDEDGHHANSAAPTPPNEQSLGRPLLSSLKPPGTSDGLLHEGIATPVPGSSAQTPIPTPVTARPPLTQSPESSPTTEQAPTLPLPSHGSTSSSGGTPGKPERMKSGLIPKILRRPTLPKALTSANLLIHGRRASSSEAHSPVSEAPTDGAHSEKPVRPEGKRGKSFRKRQPTAIGYNLGGEEDIVGIVMLEIQGATDLPRLTNMTRTGWDMDPFVIISFGKKVFRTRVIRHSRNPVWEEKLLFHVRRYETRFDVRLTVLDWDKLTSNDHIGDATFSVETLLATAPKMDEQTGLYDISADGEGEMVNFHLPLQTAKEMPWESRHSPMISFRAKYQSYDALRQKFWRQYLKQYDADDNGTMSRLEITSMLDSLGSTLSGETIDAFFSSRGKDTQTDELTIGDVVQSIETELFRPTKERKRLDAADYNHAMDLTTPNTPALGGFGAAGGDPFGQLDFAGPPGHIPPEEAPGEDFADRVPPPAYPTESNQQELADTLSYGPNTLTAPVPSGQGVRPMYPPHLSSSSATSEVDGEESPSGSTSPGGAAVERVINVKTCPLCHRPRLGSKGEVDIVTHLAICASQDWERVDKIVVGNFVTSSQAQRKWMMKLIGKVSNGAYRLGANSANIIIQNRMTGHLEEEKMQVYVRLGIRMLYKGAKSRMEGARARSLLKSMSVKQGQKYDDPASAKEIPAFVAFHRLNVDEMLQPPSSYKTFNEFFYRKLKPDARPVEEPDNPYRLVSGADCRMMAFETVQDATRIWIKGREFTVARLLGDAYKSQAERYQGGALAIFRLAPQDYHRFHSPVDGTIGPITYIAGEYYTVNPQAIRTALDVYGENARKIVPIDSPYFGRVMAVCIGAMMVGSILTTKSEGDQVKRGEEFGYFAFGGSTIVLLFEKGTVEWDEDLVINGKASLETLVRVGMGVGRRRQ